ncbi:MAG: hypothetical protein M1831_003789 [Alyxoria varia]|nr:MAG: hypothetical protein M1831_003789 [Alyxoria varia]
MSDVSRQIANQDDLQLYILTTSFTATTDSLLMSSPLDDRSDEQILIDLQVFKPLDKSSERNIWAFWDSGLAACKPWCQRNVISWVRRHGCSWNVRVLDMVDGSPNHYSKYIPDTTAFFPDSLRNRTMTGTHVAAHAADVIRLPLLYLHGGVWLDVGFILFRDLDDLYFRKLSDPGNPLEIAGFKISALQRGSVAKIHWQDIFVRVWAGRDSAAGMCNHKLLRHLPRYEVPFSTGEPPAFAYADFVDYLAQMFCLERLRHLREPDCGWDGPKFFAERVLLYECVSEVYWAQHGTHWCRPQPFELLSRQREGADGLSNDFKLAEVFMRENLGTSSTMKLSHGLVTEQRDYLAKR